MIPGSAPHSRNPVSINRHRKAKKAESNIYSRTRRLSPHPEKNKSNGSSLMSLYSVNTDLTTSSVQSIRRRFKQFYQEKDNREKDRAMADVQVATRHIPKYGRRTRLPSLQTTIPSLPVSNEIFPDQGWHTKRSFDVHNKESMNEWDIKQDCDGGKACLWDSVHRRVMTSVDYNSIINRPNVLSLQRNGIPEASRGDKSYQSPEYSTNFHKEGSTRPIPNFGGREQDMSDTHIPLVEPLRRYKTFTQKELERQHTENEYLVAELERWRPATPLIWRPSKGYAKTELQPVQTPSSVSGL